MLRGILYSCLRLPFIFKEKKCFMLSTKLETKIIDKLIIFNYEIIVHFTKALALPKHWS